jgi:glutamine amidotransferase
MKPNFKIAIVNYEVGNTCSVTNAFKRFDGCDVVLTDDTNTIKSADAIILPGVGAYRDAVTALNEKKMIPILENVAFTQKKPFLAICLGMQLLFEKSEESPNYAGLGWIPGQVIKFKSPDLYVPHFGWNDVQINKASPIFEALPPTPNFYFAHSFHAECANENVLAYCKYDVSFPAIVQKDNVFGMQFHPEKSHSNGLALLKNFIHFAKGSYA